MNNPPQSTRHTNTQSNHGHQQQSDIDQPQPNAAPHSQRDGRLIPFPTPVEGQVQPAVLDGELLSDEENAAVAGRLTGQGLAQLSPRVVLLVRVVTESPRTAQLKAAAGYRVRKAPRDVTRLCWFALRGHGRWITKAWTWATHADLRADARAARLAGDRETRRAAQETIRADARARWAKLGIALHRMLAAGLLVAFLAGVLVLVDSQVDRADMWPWLAGIYSVLGVAGVVLVWVLKAAPIGWLVAAVWEGRDRTPGASWLHRPDREDADSWIDERMISQALAHLGIGPLDRFFKVGGELVYTVPARIDGDGTYAQLRLPMGVTADMVAAKRTTLAANLAWRPGPPRARKPACWICGSRTRANSAPAPARGPCRTTARWTYSKESRWASRNGVR